MAIENVVPFPRLVWLNVPCTFARLTCLGDRIPVNCKSPLGFLRQLHVFNDEYLFGVII